jgi:hypothetical protein
LGHNFGPVVEIAVPGDNGRLNALVVRAVAADDVHVSGNQSGSLSLLFMVQQTIETDMSICF